MFVSKYPEMGALQCADRPHHNLVTPFRVKGPLICQCEDFEMDHLSGRQGHSPHEVDAGQWVFTGDMQDRGRFDARCAWCRKADLRITFEVRQAVAEPACHVCQVCLGRGTVQVEHDGRVLEGAERSSHVSELVMRLMHRTCRDVLRDLMARSDDPALPEIAVYFDRNLQLSPGHAATLLLALAKSGLDADPAIFAVQLRSTAHRLEFADLSEREKLALWPVLSPAIRNRLIWLGFAPQRYATPRQPGARLRPARLPAFS